MSKKDDEEVPGGALDLNKPLGEEMVEIIQTLVLHPGMFIILTLPDQNGDMHELEIRLHIPLQEVSQEETDWTEEELKALEALALKDDEPPTFH